MGRVLLRIAKFYRQQLIVLKVTELRYPKQSLFRRVLIVECQEGTWIFLNFQHMAMFVAGKTQEVVSSNDKGLIAEKS